MRRVRIDEGFPTVKPHKKRKQKMTPSKQRARARRLADRAFEIEDELVVEAKDRAAAWAEDGRDEFYVHRQDERVAKLRKRRRQLRVEVRRAAKDATADACDVLVAAAEVGVTSSVSERSEYRGTISQRGTPFPVPRTDSSSLHTRCRTNKRRVEDTVAIKPTKSESPAATGPSRSSAMQPPTHDQR